MRHRHLSVVFFFVAATTFGSFDSVGPSGINSLVTGLNGIDIQIGQSEGGRASMPINPTTGFAHDAAVFSASNTNPRGSFFQTTPGFGDPNLNNTSHATEVAGVMIGTDAEPPCGVCTGVAQNAALYSVGIGDITNDPTWSISLNRILNLSGVTIRATNASTGAAIQQFIEEPNGNNDITQYFDWSSRRYNEI